MNYEEFEAELERSPMVTVRDTPYYLWEGLLWRLGDENEVWLLLRDEMAGDRRVRCQWLELHGSWVLTAPVGKQGSAYCASFSPRRFLDSLNAEATALRSSATDLLRVLALAYAEREDGLHRQLAEATAMLSDMDNILEDIE